MKMVMSHLKRLKMNYASDILTILINKYENKKASSQRATTLILNKTYSQYANRYNYDANSKIDLAIKNLCDAGLIQAQKNSAGQYQKITLNTAMLSKCYEILKRESITEQKNKLKQMLNEYTKCELELVRKIANDWVELLKNDKKLPYDLKYDILNTKNTLNAILAILKLEKESYIRNFSTALFKDSKKFQKEFKAKIEAILFDYTNEIIQKEAILEFYNLYENPAYVQIKGDVILEFADSSLNLCQIPGGIALLKSSLEKIKKIKILSSNLVTVENLTTYHDLNEKGSSYIYLGGYHSQKEQILLEKIYANNKEISYFHTGDLDVYGFLILEILKEKTNIAFKPLMMDLATFKKFYEAKIYKELTPFDIKIIKKYKNTKLSEYENILDFMLENNCKVEQESIKALELL